MADKVEFEVAGMRTVANGLDGVASQIDAILTEVRSASTAYFGTWGSDEFGDPFAKGDNGYETRDPALQEVLRSKAARLREYSNGLRDGATSLETAEAENTDGFRS